MTANPELADILPLSPLQEGLLFLSSYSSDGPDVYTVQLAVDLTGELDAARLRKSVQALLARHTNLRSCFWFEDLDHPVALVPVEVEAPWTELDLGALPDPGTEATRIGAAQRAIRFDLDVPPLFRFHLLRWGPQAHRLLITSHHILLDGWSNALLVRELLELYRAGGDADALPPAGQYRDYLAWLDARDRELSIDAWRRALNGARSCTPFSGARNEGGVERASLVLDEQAHDRITTFARTRGLTLNTVLQGAWLVALSGFAGTTDVITGQAVAGRPAELPRVGEMIGLFLNTVPVRARLRHDEPFDAFLGRLQAEQASLLDHQYLDLATVTRAAGAGELFDTLLVIENYPVDEDALERSESGTGLRVERVSGHDGAHYPVMLTVVPGGGRLRLELKYRPGALEHQVAELLLAKVRTLLETVVAEPSISVGRSGGGERSALTGPVETVEYPDVTRLIELALERESDGLALIAGETRLTRHVLNERAERLAGVLAGRGMGAESVVGLATGYHADLVVGLLAVLKAGAAYLPLDLAYPVDRLRHMVSDARPSLILTTGALPDGLSGLAPELDVTTVRPGPGGRPDPHSLPGHPAYVVYTSGSTGKPQGVAGTRLGLANRLEWLQRAEPLGSGDLVLAKSSISFVDGSTELLGALAAGAVVVLAPAEARKDVFALNALIGRYRPVRVTGVPSLLRAMGESATGELGSVRTWISSGEALTPAHLDALGTGRIVNLYGSSEASGDSLYCPDARTSLSLGAPIANTSARVLDAWLRDVPTGGIGELYLAGLGLARGYLGDAALTASRFVADPGSEIGERLYRTGDLVRLRPDGTVDFLGRTDEQVKIRGFRVEPAEIESVLTGIDGIAAAAVGFHSRAAGPARIVAYLVTADGGPLDLAAVRAAAAARLAEHQVPSVYVPLGALPTTPSGKIARRELPAPDLTLLSGGDRPETADERTLARLFAEVLGLDEVGVHDGFAELGGDSIVCVQLVGKARAAGLSLQPKDVFEYKTVAALAGIVRRPAAEEPAREGATVLDTWRREHAALSGPGVEDVLPATPLQEGMVFLSGFDTDGEDIYTMQLALRIDGVVDADRLRAAAQLVLDRHPALRAGFHQTEGGDVVQVIARDVPVDWTLREVSTVDEASTVADAERARRFDLTAPPLVRFTVLRLPDGRHRLLITNHHTVLDGWSIPLLARELFATYAGTDATEPDGYLGYLEWLAGKDNDAARESWRTALDGVGGPTLLAAPGASAATGGSELLPLALPEELAGQLGALARRTNVTVNTVVQFAWAVVLGRATGRDDVVFGATVSGRSAEVPGVESVLGLMINTVPVRVALPPRSAVEDALAELQLAQARLIEHQHTGLAEIHRLAGHRELFDTLLVFESFPIDEAALEAAERAGGLDVEVVGGRSLTHYPLTVTVFPAGGLEIVLEYRPELFTAAEATGIADRLREVLEAMAARPDAPVATLPSASHAERARVLGRWNDTARPDGPLLPELFDQQVRAHPERPAIVCGEDVRTFAEAAAEADRLASALVARGAGPEAVVAVRLERSVAAMTALLAVLRSGAVYLPIDPAYPPERVRGMLADASPVAIVTDLPGEYGGVPVVRPGESGPAGPAGTLRPDNGAYLIYTSGSTGKPKGVLVSHRSIANLFHSHRRALYEPAKELAGSDGLRVAHAWPLAFDAAWQPQLWLFDGHTVHVVPEDRRTDPAALAKIVTEDRIDFIEVPPAMLAPLTDLGVFSNAGHRLAMIGFGGDAVGEAQWRELAAIRGLAAVNLYGPTECTVDALAAEVRDSERPLIGRPVDNARAYVLDARLGLVAPGVIGELYLAGRGVARGYLGLPGLTADRFVADPFTPGERMYRTGDLVRWTADGALEYLGRADGQVKIRGYRVEPGEIEASLSAHPDVTQAVVVAIGGRLAAYVVAARGRRPAVAVLRRWLAGRLPEFMVPSSFAVLAELPVSAHGKVDRTRLPAPRFEAGVPYRAPLTERQDQLCAAFAQALEVERVGLDDDFFALGGDSLASMRVIGFAARAGIALTPREVFQHRSVGALLESVVPEQENNA